MRSDDSIDPGRSNAPDPRQLFGNGDEAPAVPCHVVRALMPSMSGGDIDPETEGVLARHTLECLSCRRESLAFAEARSALSTLAEGASAAPHFDDDFFASLRHGIVGEIHRESQRAADVEVLRTDPKSLPKRNRLLDWLPAAAALIVTLVGGVLVGRSMDRSYAPKPSAPPVTRSVVDTLRPMDIGDPELLRVMRDIHRWVENADLREGAESNALQPVNVPRGQSATFGKQKDF